jgi:hypothetical protein
MDDIWGMNGSQLLLDGFWSFLVLMAVDWVDKRVYAVGRWTLRRMSSKWYKKRRFALVKGSLGLVGGILGDKQLSTLGK